MELLRPISQAEVNRMTRTREGEIKIGERVLCADADWQKSLETTPASFVLLGIAEDIGVRANFGRPGAYSAFHPALDSFLNQQQNEFLSGEQVMVLGEVYTEDLMNQARELNVKHAPDLAGLRELVADLDKRVTQVVQAIVASGKTPLIVGGGHNNAYGNIRGAAAALNKPIQVINCDPHLDFRATTEGRHSGNGFSSAFRDGYLQRYAVFGAHEHYNNGHAVEQFRANPGRLHFVSFESVFVREERDYKNALADAVGFVKDGPCGVELDLDSITNVPSSARTSSGISPLQARQYVHRCASDLQCVYLHIAEGAPVLAHLKADIKTGKLIAYLLTDFIRARLLAKAY